MFTGLFLQSWRYYKPRLIAVCFTLVALILLTYFFILAPALPHIPNTKFFFEFILGFITLFFIMLLFISLALFLMNLHSDVKRRDTWLHTPAPFYQLIFAKLANALLFFSVTNSILLIFLSYVLKTYLALNWLDTILFFALSVVICLYAGVSMLCSSFFFYTVFIQLRQFLNVFFATIFTLMLFSLFTAFIDKYLTLFANAGPISHHVSPFFEAGDLKIFFSQSPIVYWGDIFFDITLIIIFIIVGVKWLERVLVK